MLYVFLPIYSDFFTFFNPEAKNRTFYFQGKPLLGKTSVFNLLYIKFCQDTIGIYTPENERLDTLFEALFGICSSNFWGNCGCFRCKVDGN